MKLISLTQGKFAMVDDDDYEHLNRWKWYCNNRGYAVRITPKAKNRRAVLMHREILNPQNGLFTDHIDGNKLNNQRSNLRNCNHQQNSANCKRAENNTSGYKGVSRDSRRKNSWKAAITINGKQVYICTCKTPEEAARAYDAVAMNCFGEFANLNFREVYYPNQTV